MSGAAAPFDADAAHYDAWYDTDGGRAIFADELTALAPLLGGLRPPWLEVGSGGGRFAAALGARYGVDPAEAAVLLARQRGIQALVGRGELLPFADGTFGAVLLVLTLCFVHDPAAALREARRVLAPGGGVVLGLVPADGPWGEHYRRLGAAGHPYYRAARFFDRRELDELLGQAALRRARVRSALVSPAGQPPIRPGPREGDAKEAGFLAVLATPL